MKNIVLIGLLFPAFLFSQTPITFDEVVEIEGVSKDDLYNRGLQFMIKAFKDADEVIQLKDKENGQIIGKGNFSYVQSRQGWGGSPNTEGVVNFTIKLLFKDGKYRYVLTDFIHDANWSFNMITDAPDCGCKFPLANKRWKGNIWNDIKEQINAKVDVITSNLINDMKKGVDDEW